MCEETAATLLTRHRGKMKMDGLSVNFQVHTVQAQSSAVIHDVSLFPVFK